ncbi:receptor-type tyrosine-protein phosphatase F-like [Simochromis diagramma]|uniref:receptor-type tyrosine-protein phosphatase F-like n=1 Tax=Simochromis diagramma TaxID=43689 RepID=UPI001A7EE12F|nr:receptor-type tyrosine-protein phosphatase F-like [Simochromis diagramma]XP_039900734.1 receptor-type tyrosine-protein phosphatase F-like [Simochromis diagramma]
MVYNIHLAGSHRPREGLLVLFSLSYMLFLSLAESPPSFITFPVNQTGISGGVASFVCQARGEPKPRITWFKIGKKVSSQRFAVIEFDGGLGSVLRIQPLRVYRDAAIYKCIASNSAGEVNVSARLEVLEGKNGSCFFKLSLRSCFKTFFPPPPPKANIHSCNSSKIYLVLAVSQRS